MKIPKGCKYIMTYRLHIYGILIYSKLNSVFFISFVYITVSIFSIIRTLDYPDYLLKSQRVQIIEVQLY